MNSGSASSEPDITDTDALATACLCAARDLGRALTYAAGRETMDILWENFEALSPQLSRTQRSLLATSVLFFLWDSVKTQHALLWPQIIHINDNRNNYNKLSSVIMTCFVWIMSYEDGRLRESGLTQLYSVLDEDVSTWDPKHILHPPATTESASASINSSRNSQYFDMIRTKAFDWVIEIATDFNNMGNTKIGKLNTEPRNANDIENCQILDTVTDAVIKSLLSHLLIEDDLTLCWKILNAHSFWLSPTWLSTLAMAVLLILGAREEGPLNCGQSKQLRKLLLWIQPDLSGVEEFANKITPGSMIAWKKPTFGAFKEIWHESHTFEGMEIPWELDIDITESTVLCHVTTCKTLTGMLKDATGRGNTIKIKARPSEFNYTGANLVWTAVQLTDQEKDTIPDTCWGKELLIDSPRKYGSVCLQFPLKSVLGALGSYHAHILSTRLYTYEYSQSIFVSPFKKVLLRQYENNGECEQVKLVGTLETPASLLGHKWKLAFSNRIEKSWTHPELVFNYDLSMPLESCNISFIHHGSCVGGKRCDDCGLCSATAAREKFDKLLNHEENQKILETYDISHETTENSNDAINLEISPKKQRMSTRKRRRVSPTL